MFYAYGLRSLGLWKSTNHTVYIHNGTFGVNMRDNNHTFYGDVPLKDWLIDWMGFNATFSSISAISWIENWPKLIYPKQVYYRRLYTIFGHFFTRKGEKMPQNLYNCFISFWKLPPSLSGSTLLNPVIVFVRKVLTYE